jgi:hypothetical protein
MLKLTHNEPSSNNPPLKFHDIFKFIDGSSSSFEIYLDPQTLNCILPDMKPPEWAQLDYEQCENCPLDAAVYPKCPVAYCIATMTDAFREFSSHETSHVLIMTRHRDYSKATTLQEGLASLMGLYMASSGCPHLEKLKPLTHLHLPFASLDENVLRTAAMYLLIQYHRMKKGKHPDWDMKQLETIYDHIRTVNSGISRRLRRAARKEASLTALANLDYTASLVPFVIDETLENIERSVTSYMEE